MVKSFREPSGNLSLKTLNPSEYWCRRSESNRHELAARGILSPVRLPVSPLRHGNKYKKNDSVCQFKKMIDFIFTLSLQGRGLSMEGKLNLTTYFALCYLKSSWGCSSAGRALEWHSRGRRFDPVQLHHLTFLFRAFPVYSPKGRAVVSTGRRSESTHTEFDPVQLHQ
jgi:hypothetical protein